MPPTLTRRDFALAAVAAVHARPRRPNIIVHAMDDQRFDQVGWFGGRSRFEFLRTTNLDRIAANGVCFRNAFVTFSLCSPSRATMFTGQDVRTHGVNRLAAGLRPGSVIFPGLLKQAGYETGFVGKWHIGSKSDTPRPEFDYWAGVRGQGRYIDPVMNVNGTRTEFHGYATDVFMDLALEFLARPRNKPFFLWLAQKAPHAPCTPPRHLESLYEEIDVPLPETYEEDHSDKPAWFTTQHDHDAFLKLLYPEAKYQQYVKNFCRTIKSVDENLGRLLHELDDRGLSEDTVIVHISDNGHFLGEHRLYSKMLMYEESIRIPFLVRYPRLVPYNPRICEDMVLNLDVAPTVLDLAGVDVPDWMEGRSLRRQVEGKEVKGWRRSFRYEYFNSRWGLPDFDGVRTADGWMYCRFPDWEQMYDINADPKQVRNLAADPAYATKKKELQAELRGLGGGRRRLRGPSPYTPM